MNEWCISLNLYKIHGKAAEILFRIEKRPLRNTRILIYNGDVLGSCKWNFSGWIWLFILCNGDYASISKV